MRIEILQIQVLMKLMKFAKKDHSNQIWLEDIKRGLTCGCEIVIIDKNLEPFANFNDNRIVFLDWNQPLEDQNNKIRNTLEKIINLSLSSFSDVELYQILSCIDSSKSDGEIYVDKNIKITQNNDLNFFGGIYMILNYLNLKHIILQILYKL